MRPPVICLRPIWITPPKKVPVVRTTVRLVKVLLERQTTPWTRFLSGERRRATTLSCQKWRGGICSKCQRQRAAKRERSFCARGLQRAGPLERLSRRNWIMLSSVTTPESPPKASISRTSWPLATPPMAGLQDIWPILVMSMVMSKTWQPMWAAAAAASLPA